jgi:hypothetical protein
MKMKKTAIYTLTYLLMLALLLTGCSLVIDFGNSNETGNGETFLPPNKPLDELLGLPPNGAVINQNLPSLSGKNYTFYLVKGVATFKSLKGWVGDPTFPNYDIDWAKNELATETAQYSASVEGKIYYFTWQDIEKLRDVYGPIIDRAKTDPVQLAILTDSGFLKLYDDFWALTRDATISQFIPDKRAP